MKIAAAIRILPFLVILAPAGPAAQTALTKTTVAMLDCDGLPSIEADIGAADPVRLVIDTGNVNSVLDTEIAHQASLPLTPLESGDPSAHFATTTLPALRIGNRSLLNIPILSIDLAPMITKGEMPHASGTIAYTAFKDRLLELDFLARKVRISEPLDASERSTSHCSSMCLIHFGKDGPPIVVATGFELNGHPLSAQIDTMFTGSFLIYGASITKAGLERAASGAKETEFFPFTDGGVKMRKIDQEILKFAGENLSAGPSWIYFPTTGVHEPDALFDAAIGIAAFQNKIVSLDFRNMTFCIGP